MTPDKLNALNSASDSQVLEIIGGPLEGQTWLAQRVAVLRPFASVEALFAAFQEVVATSTEAEQIMLIASHPDLAGKLAVDKTLSAASIQEQAAAGLDRLTPGEYAEFHRLNSDYRSHFNFPFVICARENTKDSILASFRVRLKHTRDQEINLAIAEVLKILRLRLIDQYA
jgi:OHCU decarboxylase